MLTLLLYFWFKILSVEILVFPVCLSPTISSRCPNPIGTIESIDKIPVLRDSDTVNRVMIPADGDSTIQYVLRHTDVRGVVINLPDGSRIDPNNDRPKGIDNTLDF